MSLYLVRHGSAGQRSPSVADIERPLDDAGRDQAERLRDMLALHPVDQVLSSPARRCKQTVAPIAAAMGVGVEVSAALYEGQPEQPAVSLLRRLAAADSSAILCSHGDLIPRILDALAADDVALAGNGCAKGSVWLLEPDGGKITDGRYLGAP